MYGLRETPRDRKKPRERRVTKVSKSSEKRKGEGTEGSYERRLNITFSNPDFN